MNDFIDFQQIIFSASGWSSTLKIVEAGTVSIRRSSIIAVSQRRDCGDVMVTTLGLNNGHRLYVKGDHYTVMQMIKTRPKA